MKKLLFLICLISSFCSYGQIGALVPGTQQTWTIGTRTIVTSTPYDTVGKKKRFIMSFVGNGINSAAAALAQSPTKRWGQYSAGQLPKDSFFIVAFVRKSAENGGAASLSDIDAVLTAVFNRCTFLSTTDSTMNSMTGLSQGNREDFRYLSDWGPEVIGYTPLHRNKFSREVLLSNGADEDAKDYRDASNDYKPSGTRVWYGSADGVTGTFYPNDIYQFMVARNPFPRTQIDTVMGGGHTDAVWDSAWSINNDIWQWLIQYSPTNLSPDANAGLPQVLTPGTTTGTLNGTGSVDPDGSISAYLWQFVSGPNTPSITSPASATTGVTGMINGVYRFKLTVTDNHGLTDADTTSIAIVPSAYSVPMFPGDVAQYNGRNRIIPMQNMVDGDTLTSTCPLGQYSTAIDIPPQGTEAFYWFQNDSTYHNIRIRVWNGPTAGPTPLVFTLYNSTLTDSLVVRKAMTVNSWNYIDTAETRGVWFPVKFIKFTVYACFVNATEMRIQGTAVAKGDSVFGTPATVAITPMYRYMGQVMNGDEADSLFVVGGDVFNNWWYTDSSLTYNPNARTFVNNVYGNPISHMNTYKARGFWMEARMFMGARWTYTPFPSPVTCYGCYGDNKKYVFPITNADTTLFSVYKPEAQHAYAFARWAGRTSGSYSPHTFTLYGGGALTSGADYYKVMHFDNEHDFGNTERYQPVRPQVAKMRIIYDGVGNTQGAGVGVKNADPTMLVYAGPLVGIDTVAAKGFAFESSFKAGRNNMPLDGFVYNQYFVYGGAQAFFNPSANGISPGQLGWLQYARGIVSVRDKYFPGKYVSIKEFGWDKNQNTSYSALAVGSLTGEIVGANYIIQAFHLGRAAKVDDMRQYRGRDEGTLADNSDFATSGQVVAQTGVRWAANYWMFTMYDICQKYNSKYPTVLLDGDSTSLTQIKYDSSAADGTDTITVVMWMSTNNDSYTSVTFNAGASVTWCEKITMLKGDFNGVRTTLTADGHNIPVGTVGETPVYVRYKLGAEPPPPNEPPVANAGPDQTIQLPTSTTTISGLASTDTDGTITNYLWTLVSAPIGATPAITAATSAVTGITGMTLAGSYTFQVQVTDNNGLSDTDIMEITVLPLSRLRGGFKFRNGN